MNFHKQLSALFTEIEREAKANPQFAERLQAALGVHATVKTEQQNVPTRSNRRTPAAIDPFEEYRQGADSLRSRLDSLDLEKLRDVIAQYGMDRSKLAMKWKDKNRVIEHIIDTVAHRAEKGNAFRAVDPSTNVIAPGASTNET